MRKRRTSAARFFLDGVPQSSELDEYVYHEALVHPCLLASTIAKNIFIAGGGEGAVLREVLRHNTVEHVTMVDIDSQVIELSRRYLAKWHQGKFDDPRAEACLK